jgi:hypothetical protein
MSVVSAGLASASASSGSSESKIIASDLALHFRDFFATGAPPVSVVLLTRFRTTFLMTCTSLVGGDGWAGAMSPLNEYSKIFMLGLRDVMASPGGLTLLTREVPESLACDFEGPFLDSRKLSKRGLSGPSSVFKDDFPDLGVFFGLVSLPALLGATLDPLLACALAGGAGLPVTLPFSTRASSASLCSFNKVAAEANPACAPVGTCCALEPLFSGCVRGRKKALGDRSCGEERVIEVVLTLRRRLSGVMEGGW